MVECAFGMMKLNWGEMLVKTNMHVTIVRDMFMCSCILHNLLIQKDDDINVEELMRSMQIDFDNDVQLQGQAPRGNSAAQQNYIHCLE